MFKSAQDVRKYIESNDGRVNEDKLMNRLQETVNYYQGEPEDMDFPQGVPIDDRRNIKIVEILDETREYVRKFDLGLFEITTYCTSKINDIVRGNRIAFAQLLLLSQCMEYRPDEHPGGRYVVKGSKDDEIIARALNLLYVTVKNKKPDYEEAKSLLEEMRNNNDLVILFPSGYFSQMK
ncbi:MAG: hypothetical protein LBQ03_00055 [Puniceicoccales bacterium]|nr:hypothetical protein [Puniceicoccales bacterium]